VRGRGAKFGEHKVGMEIIKYSGDRKKNELLRVKLMISYLPINLINAILRGNIWV